MKRKISRKENNSIEAVMSEFMTTFAELQKDLRYVSQVVEVFITQPSKLHRAKIWRRKR